MTRNSKLQTLADRQWRDYRLKEPGTCFSNPGFVTDLAGAYELQDTVAALRVGAGDRIIGYKVGCTGQGTIQQFGMAGPIRGCLFESEQRQSGVTLDIRAFANLAVEGEMAVRIGPEGEIEAVFPVIELHHFVFRRASKTLVELVANNGLNGGIVLPDETRLAFDDLTGTHRLLSVRINGLVIAASGLWPLPGGAAASLDWLRGHLGPCGLRLDPGHIVLTGTPLGLYPVRSGDHIAVLVDGQVGVECSVL